MKSRIKTYQYTKRYAAIQPNVITVPEKKYEYRSNEDETSFSSRDRGGVHIISCSGLSYASDIAGGISLAKSILRI